MREATISTPEPETRRYGDPRVRPFREVWPRIAETAWLAPDVMVVGDVEIGDGSSIWYGTTLRGDVNAIRIGARTNLQDHCVVHVTRDRYDCILGDEVTVGHRAVVHGCTVADGALIGIGAIVLDGASVGEEALVGAGAVVAPGMEVPNGMLAVGVPARVTRPLRADERERQRARTLEYVENARLHAAADVP